LNAFPFCNGDLTSDANAEESTTSGSSVDGTNLDRSRSDIEPVKVAGTKIAASE
jgi:hypothetical protein